MSGSVEEIVLRRLDAGDLWRIGEVDRTERVEAEYLARQSKDGRSLTLERAELDPPLDIGSWPPRGIERRVAEWKPQVEAGGAFLGAILGSALVAFAVLGPPRQSSAELCALFVDRKHRRLGLGGRLMREVERIARDSGATSIWLGSNRTASAVEFYLGHGCKAIGLRTDELVTHHPGDPVFAKSIGPSGSRARTA